MFKVSIIIVNYNTKTLTKECIGSIYENTKGCSFEVIVIDNASQDGSQLDLSILPSPHYRYIYNVQNVGFAKANNQAARIARGDYLLFLNSDTLLLNDVAAILSEQIVKEGDVGIIGPKFLNSDKTLQISCRTFPSIKYGITKVLPFMKYALISDYKRYYLKEIDYDSKQYVDTISAGAMLISKQIFEAIGRFDEKSFMYAEDADICKRVRDRGYMVLYFPAAILIHYGGQSSKLNSTKAILSYYMAAYNLYDKYYFKGYGIIIKPLFYFKAAIDILFNYFKKDKRIAWNSVK